MKYYFITYQATNKQGSVSIWNQVINQSPINLLRELKRLREMEATLSQFCCGKHM